MRNFTVKLALISLLSTILFLPGCTDNFEALNTPDTEIVASNVGATTLGQAFAQSQYRGMYGLHWQFQISTALFSDLYTQYFSTTAAYFDSDQYIEVGDWIDLAWTSFYGDAAPQLKFVRDFTAENDMPVRNAVANIWRVQLYHRITDYWGPIPYSEFGNGKETVPYDSQEEIYKDFFSRLGNAVSTLESNRGGSAFGDNDLIYAGDVGKWIKFANSLQLRLAMRVKYVAPDLAKQEAEEAVAGGVMEDNSDNAMVLTTQNNRNPYFTITDWKEFRMSSSMESLLEGYDDPRKGVYFKPAVNGDRDGDDSPYEGMRNGLKRTTKNPELNAQYSDMGTRWLNSGRGGVNPPIPVMRASEVYLLRAEGALEGWNMGGGTAEEFYNEGIRMSLSEEKIGASDAKIDEYISSTKTPEDPADRWNSGAMSDIPVKFMNGATKEKKLEQIITQKWLALYPESREAFAELRRTGYPKLYPIIKSRNKNLSESDVFRRMTFVVSEFNNNTKATENAISLLDGPDQNNTKLWWDEKPDNGLGQ